MIPETGPSRSNWGQTREAPAERCARYSSISVVSLALVTPRSPLRPRALYEWPTTRSDAIVALARLFLGV
jgi:hypothetical protein